MLACEEKSGHLCSVWQPWHIRYTPYLLLDARVTTLCCFEHTWVPFSAKSKSLMRHGGLQSDHILVCTSKSVAPRQSLCKGHVQGLYEAQISISFPLSLSQMTTNMAAHHSTDLFSDTSGGLKSEVSFTALKSRCCRFGSFRKVWEGECILPFLPSRGLLPSLAHGPFLVSLQALVSTLTSPTPLLSKICSLLSPWRKIWFRGYCIPSFPPSLG